MHEYCPYDPYFLNFCIICKDPKQMKLIVFKKHSAPNCGTYLYISRRVTLVSFHSVLQNIYCIWPDTNLWTFMYLSVGVPCSKMCSIWKNCAKDFLMVKKIQTNLLSSKTIPIGCVNLNYKIKFVIEHGG